jgi:hypothetical protein
MSSRRRPVVIGLVVLVGALAYLRDPGWLIGVQSGFRPWERAADGIRSRSTGGHASFFIPAAARSLTLPIRTASGPGDSPVTVAITVDDRPAGAVELHDEGWHRLTLAVTGRSTRRVRRVDIHVDRTGRGNRGVAIGEVELR